MARAKDSATVELTVPPAFQRQISALLTSVEQLQVNPDQPARVLIDEQSGIIVMGDDVRIDQVAVAQGSLTVRITETPEVAQPAPLSDGETVVVPRTGITVEEGDQKMAILPRGVSLQELVAGLNALGVSPRDLISILQAIKAAGALQAEIEVM
jgi:flagellar P-ring protein precursor FlgI